MKRNGSYIGTIKFVAGEKMLEAVALQLLEKEMQSALALAIETSARGGWKREASINPVRIHRGIDGWDTASQRIDYRTNRATRLIEVKK